MMVNIKFIGKVKQMKRITVSPALVLILFTMLLTGCSSESSSISPTLPAFTSTPLIMTPSIEPSPTTTLEKSSSEEHQPVRFVIDSQNSVVSYAVDETFLNQNNRLATAVGKTSEITGELEIDLKNPSNISFGEFVVNIQTLKSDSSRRDSAIQSRWLESAKFPLARFNIREVKNFPENPRENETVKFQIVGDLTIRETTRSVTWDVSAMLKGDQLLGQATTFIYMADWGIEPPSIAGVLNVKDGVTLTLEFVFIKQ